jgi:quercetin dioxygenase-like cupin family protein
VRFWDLREIPTPDGSRSPVVLHSDDEARAILIGLEPGQQLGYHQVKEHAFVTVLEGKAEIETVGEDTIEAEPGILLLFEPDERRTVSTTSGARLLLLLAPWPGEGHYRGEEKASAG